jgi:flavin-dependent dehydrogenase
MHSPSFDTDVLILGAGPAGAAAAITAAAAGLSVTILERERFPRDAPGEALHPGVQPLLQQLGVEEQVLSAGFLRYPGHSVRWDGPQEFQPFGRDADGPWLGFQVWRPIFDGILLDRARHLGVNVVQPCQVEGAITAEGRAKGVETQTGPLRGRFTVDGTGRWRALSRWLNLDWDQTGPRRHVWYGYVTGECPKRDDCPALTADDEGWTWVARIRPGTYQWARLDFGKRRPDPDWRPSELSELTPCGPTCGADATWRIARQPAGPGYFLVGDAAAVLDPASSHGVLKALMSGILAGHLIAQVLHRSVSENEATDQYSGWVREWFEHDVAQLGEYYSRLAGFAESVSVHGS